jgi:hypothetical protein
MSPSQWEEKIERTKLIGNVSPGRLTVSTPSRTKLMSIFTALLAIAAPHHRTPAAAVTGGIAASTAGLCAAHGRQ